MRHTAIEIKRWEVDRYPNEVHGRWLPARSENHKFESYWQRITDCYFVITGKADILFWEDKPKETE